MREASLADSSGRATAPTIIGGLQCQVLLIVKGIQLDILNFVLRRGEARVHETLAELRALKKFSLTP
jgi:hypothetical protein